MACPECSTETAGDNYCGPCAREASDAEVQRVNRSNREAEREHNRKKKD